MRKPRTKKRTALYSLTLLSSTATASFLSPRSILSSLPSLSLSSSNSNSNSNTTSLVSTVSTGSENPIGRFGHSSIYLPPPLNQILIFGGQLDSNSTEVVITNTVLNYRVGGEYLWRDGSGSAIPNNPTTQESINDDEQGFAFGGSTISLKDETVYLFGGLKSSGDCSQEGGGEDLGLIRSFNFNSSSYSTSSSEGNWKDESLEDWKPRTPPRRRQVFSFTIFNSTTLSNDFWVLGGISDKYSSCSSGGGDAVIQGEGEVVGYMGIDRFSPLTRQVESFEWKEPNNKSNDWIGQPISDYRVEVLGDGSTIVVLGGQTRNGELVQMDKILSFNTELREWFLQNVGGDVPLPRMGHVSTTLSSGSILVHGGLSSSSSTTTPLSDLYLLIPPPSLSSSSPSSSSNESLWNWKKLVISNDSMNSPELVYHSANQVVGGTIVVSFGLTSGGVTSDQFWFLTIDEQQGTFSWKDTFEGNEQEVEATNLTRRQLVVEELNEEAVKTMVKRVEVIVNPKHDIPSSSSSSPAAVQTQQVQNSGNNVGQQEASPSPSVIPSSSSSSLKISPPSSSSSSITPSSSPISSNSKQNSSSSSSSKSVTLGASIGATLGALTLLSIGIVLFRRSRKNHNNLNSQFQIPPMSSFSSSSDMLNSNSTMQQQGGGRKGGDAPLVSSLMFTRPVQRRMLSLGSTISERGIQEEEGENPFGDEFREGVNELGQLERTNSSTSTSTVRAIVAQDQQGGTNSSSLLTRSKSSVQSIPFLSTITRDLLSSPFTPSTTTNNNLGGDGGDVYTSPAPTLSRAASSRSSRRRTSQLPLPETPAELIGLAVTSDDGHEVGGLPYRNSNSNNGTMNQKGGNGVRVGVGESWEQSFLQTQPKPQSQRVEGDQGGEGIPAILRPATPSTSSGLRVRNADPFIDP